VIGKVFELDQDTGERFARRANELVDQGIVFGAAEPTLTQTNIIRIIQQRRVVCAHVQCDRQA
jgi:hypothetical protein